VEKAPPLRNWANWRARRREGVKKMNWGFVSWGWFLRFFFGGGGGGYTYGVLGTGQYS
jgi:hypothetical protein